MKSSCAHTNPHALLTIEDSEVNETEESDDTILGHKTVKFSEPVVSSAKIIAANHGGRKVKRRDKCSSNDEVTNAETKKKYCNVEDTAVEIMDQMLREFLADEKSELREINKVCSKITNSMKS